MFPKTKTDIAKAVVHMIVAAKAQSIVEDQIVERTELTEDSLAVTVASFTAGHLIAIKADPYTDRGVDYVIAKYKSWRENHKKSDEQE